MTMLSYFAVFIGLFITLFFFLTFLQHEERKPRLKSFPMVTIAIPAYNAASAIPITIESLLALDYPKDELDIIIVENGSKDNTLAIANTYKSENVRVYSIPGWGKGHALNFALSKARGKFFGALDADSYAAPDALKNIIAHFTSTKVTAVTASLKVAHPKSILEKVQQFEFYFGVFLRKTFAILNCIHVTPGPFTIYRKSFFDEHGGYEEDNITEDIEIALRMQANHYRIENAIDASVYARSPSKFSALFRQRMRWYIGFIDNLIRYNKLFSPQHGILGVFILPLAIYSIASSIILIGISLRQSLTSWFHTLLSFRLAEFQIVPYLKTHTGLFFVTPGFFTFVALLLLTLSILTIILAKRYSQDNESLGVIGYVYYTLLYFPLFALWWASALVIKLFGSYKLIGSYVRFGGVVWKNSVIDNVMKWN